MISDKLESSSRITYNHVKKLIIGSMKIFPKTKKI